LQPSQSVEGGVDLIVRIIRIILHGIGSGRDNLTGLIAGIDGGTLTDGHNRFLRLCYRPGT
jgi:hypothetical protein